MREEPADGIEGAVMAGTGITGGNNEEEADAPSTEPEEVGRTSEIPGKRMKRTVAARSQEGAGPSGQDIGEEEIQLAPETILGKRMRAEPADGIEGAVMAGTGITGGDNEEEADAPSNEPEEVGHTSEIPGKRMKQTVAAPSQEETELYDVLEAKVRLCFRK